MSKLKQLLFSLNENDRKVIEEKLKTQDQQIDQLKQQNEELMFQLSKYEIEKHKPAYCTLAGTECEYLGNVDELKQQLEESFTEEDVNGLIEDRDKTIKFLQKELAEKDKEIANLQVLIIENKNDIKEMRGFKIGDNEYDLTDEDARNDIKNQLENQTQLAIQELEKLKASADKWFEFWENSEYEGNRYDKLDVSNAYLQMGCEIDQQIKLLKGEKE